MNEECVVWYVTLPVLNSYSLSAKSLESLNYVLFGMIVVSKLINNYMQLQDTQIFHIGSCYLWYILEAYNLAVL